MQEMHVIIQIPTRNRGNQANYTYHTKQYCETSKNIFTKETISVRDDTQYLYNIKLETTVISLITSNCVMGDNGLRNASTRNSGNVASSHTIL